MRPISSSNPGRCSGSSPRSAWRASRPRARAKRSSWRPCVLFATPAHRQYVVKGRTVPDRMPAPMVRAMDALATASTLGDVVLQQARRPLAAAPVVLAGRRVPTSASRRT